MDQIYRYYETVSLQKSREVRAGAIVTAQAVAVAFGSIKGNEFQDFLEEIHPMKQKDVETSLSEMKQMGLPVEDV